MEPAAPRGKARRKRLVEAALAVIGRVGPDGLTHRLVAAEAGVPLAATTYWFASKEEIVFEAFAHAAQRDIANLDAYTEASASWSRDDVAGELARIAIGALTQDRATTVLDYGLWIEAARRPELRPLAEDWSDACRRFFASILATCAASPAPDDARLLAAAFDGLLMGQLARAHPEDEAQLTALLERLVSAFLDD